MGSENRPRRETRAYLYRCAHCEWLNLVTGEHSRCGPRKGYVIEQLRERPGAAFDPGRVLRGGYPETVQSETFNAGLHSWRRGTPYTARCGRPLVGGPEFGDLHWHEDHDDHKRGATLYCKGFYFRDPQLLKVSVVNAIEAVGRLGDAAAQLAVVHEATRMKTYPQINSLGQVPRYAGLHPLTIPIWVSYDSYAGRASTPACYGYMAPHMART